MVTPGESCAACSEDSGVWCKENESQLFVVARDHYGYVDCRWYLDMNLSRPLRWPCQSRGNREGRNTTRVLRMPPDSVVPEAAVAARNPLTPAHTVCLRFDTLEAMGRNLSLFRRSPSTGQSPAGGCISWEDGAESFTPAAERVHRNDGDGSQQVFAKGASCTGATSGAPQEPAPPVAGGRARNELMEGFPLGTALPRYPRKVRDFQSATATRPSELVAANHGGSRWRACILFRSALRPLVLVPWFRRRHLMGTSSVLQGMTGTSSCHGAWRGRPTFPDAGRSNALREPQRLAGKPILNAAGVC